MKTRALIRSAKPSHAESQRVVNAHLVRLIVDLQQRVKELEGYAHTHPTPEATE